MPSLGQALLVEPKVGYRGTALGPPTVGPKEKPQHQLSHPHAPSTPTAEHSGDFLKRSHRKVLPQQISPSAEGLNSAQCSQLPPNQRCV